MFTVHYRFGNQTTLTTQEEARVALCANGRTGVDTAVCQDRSFAYSVDEEITRIAFEAEVFEVQSLAIDSWVQIAFAGLQFVPLFAPDAQLLGVVSVAVVGQRVVSDDVANTAHTEVVPQPIAFQTLRYASIVLLTAENPIWVLKTPIQRRVKEVPHDALDALVFCDAIFEAVPGRVVLSRFASRLKVLIVEQVKLVFAL